MSDLSGSQSPIPPPPPPPQKYSNRAANALARFAQPFFSGSRPPSSQSSRADGPRSIRSKSLPGEPQTVTHKTGIAITALDISPERTHAVIAGKEILKTIQVSPDRSSEEFNIRNAVISYASTHHDTGVSMPHKDQLNVKDVKWSHGNHDRIIATAVANGRIVIYDLHRPGLQLCRFQGHNRQVHRLAFNPHLPSWLLSGSQDGTIRMWDLRSASANRGSSTCGSKYLYQGNSDAIRDVRWSPNDGVIFATASDSGAIQMWDYRKANAPLMKIAAHDRPCFAVDWHPDGKHIVSGGTDRQVKVWDFSLSAERRQKPAFQFRTPQAVTNVRWRPPSWVGESASGQWQSSQVVTSYDKEDPRVHLWDLRRPHIPFREFDRYDTPASDLLWRSKDLLWTVGEAGAFTQTDVRYAPTVASRRPMCSVAWSPTGEFVAFSQQRPRRRPLGVKAAEFLRLDDDDDSSGERSLSQSPADDIFDEAVLATSLRNRHNKSASIRPSNSWGSTPPGGVDYIPVLPLEQALAKLATPMPSQVGIITSIPDVTNDSAVFRHLASHHTPLMDEHSEHKTQTDVLNSLIESLDHNAECADEVSLARLAQTWRIIKYAILEELQRRARDYPKGGLKDRPSKDGGLIERSRPDDGRQDRVKSRLFKAVMETVPEAESSSNMTTPLVRPLPDSPKDSWSSTDSQMPSMSDAVMDLDPLPPSVLSDHNSWAMSDRILGRQSSTDDAHSSQYRWDPTQEDLDIEQRSAPRAIAGKADWRRRPDFSRENSEDDYDLKLENKRAAIRDYKQFPKKPLTLESPLEFNRPPRPDRFSRHDSSESFPMFSTSTDSSHPSKSIGASYSSSIEASKSLDPGQSSAALRRGSMLASTREESEDELFDQLISETDRIHLDRPSSPLPLITESTPLERQQPFPRDDTLNPGTTPYSTVGGISRVPIPLTPDGTDLKPWGIEAIMKESVRYYHSSSSLVDIQTAAHLLQKMHVLFRDCEQILPYEECEMVFKTYNEHLIRHSMDLEAAELRLFCVPTYPAVYEYTQADSFINVYCYTCQRPFENPTQDNSRCYRCNTPQAPCSICMSLDPPPEWVSEQQTPPIASSTLTSPDLDFETTSNHSSQSSVATEPVPASEIEIMEPFTVPRPKGSALWTWCQGCGHGGHVACITTWLVEISTSEGGCATAGCSHDCGPGPRRELNRQDMQAESKRRDSASRSAGVGLVKRDPWSKGESKAVEKVRGMLGIAGIAAATGGSGAGPNTSTNNTSPAPGETGAMSPKRVRLVTPIEQDKGSVAPDRMDPPSRD
ncbi:hypothetical protein DTO006G1_4365 [Penicillium roqueforti]|nr:hypothetical protein CBS147337_7508 [Penicillium roqueforti]KAI2760878.1 hypothetical protein DTO006G1_4365 [Penicillium roqueforti]KAI3258053.1 hypothetical protein DTO006G7_2405 [Penicillium roqueforti]